MLWEVWINGTSYTIRKNSFPSSRWITVLKINKTRDALKADNDMFASYDFLSFFENFSFEIGGHDCSLKLHEVLLGVRTLVKDKINHALKYNDA